MNIKCPKCRFRFDVPAMAGMTELQCNCPRCGTPFTYTLEETEENVARQENVQEPLSREAQPTSHGSDSTDQPTAVSNHSTSHITNSNRSAEHQSEVIPPPPPFQTAESQRSDIHQTAIPSHHQFTPPHSASPLTPPPSIANAHGQGCLKKMLLTGLLIIVALFFLIRQCTTSKSYDADTFEVLSDSNIEVATPSTNGVAPVYDQSGSNEKAPKWIQGNWHVETQYGGITLKIKGNQIAETTLGGTSYGHYKYQNHHLYCDFGDGKDFTYRLDMHQKRIDAGNGLLMRKTD